MMKTTSRLGIFVALLSALSLATAFAQSSQSQQDQKNPQAQQSQSQDNQYSGVSNPPPDSGIEANEPPVSPTPTPKPSPAVPASVSASPVPKAAAVPQPQASPADREAQSANPDEGIVTSAPSANEKNAGEDKYDNNPDDYGIVTSVPPPHAAAVLPDGFNPNNAIVNSVPLDPNALAAGTNITVRLNQSLSTDSTQRGSAFHADVMYNVYNGNQLIIPAGSEMRGTVVHISHGHHLINRATIMLRPDFIVLPDGTAYHLYAVAVESEAQGTDVNDEGGIVATHHFVKDAVEYGAGAGAGAAAGGVVGGPVGAGVGSLVGTGLVGAHMLRQPTQSADLPKGSVLIFSLTEPMPLTPTKN